MSYLRMTTYSFSCDAPCGCTSMDVGDGSKPMQVSWCVADDPGYEPPSSEGEGGNGTLDGEVDDDPRDGCLSCGAEIGHYNGCIEDPGAMCLCHLCMDDQAVTSEADCPFHGASMGG